MRSTNENWTRNRASSAADLCKSKSRERFKTEHFYTNVFATLNTCHRCSSLLHTPASTRRNQCNTPSTTRRKMRYPLHDQAQNYVARSILVPDSVSDQSLTTSSRQPRARIRNTYNMVVNTQHEPESAAVSFAPMTNRDKGSQPPSIRPFQTYKGPSRRRVLWKGWSPGLKSIHPGVDPELTMTRFPSNCYSQ